MNKFTMMKAGGLLTLVLLACTAIIGYLHLGIKLHVIFAMLTLVAALSHVFIVIKKA
ncbi:MAG: hypothetical protein NTZ10_02110 [Candidatus Saganbacteria bacterium]|nr:hypothetical protein [Candidatus Saganbacteria bacterium]